MLTELPHPIPTVKGLPLLGVLPKLFSGDPFEYLKNIMLEQGDLVQLNFGPQPVYLVSHPDYLQRILRDNYQNYRKPDMLYARARKSMGNGLILSSGDFWLRQRRMIQPHLHRNQLGNLFLDIRWAIANVLTGWEGLADNNVVVELDEKMREISGTVIMHTMFGKEILSAAEVREVGRCIMRMVKHGGRETLYGNLLPKWFLTPGRRQYEQDLGAMRATVNRIVAKCRQEKESSASLIQMLIHSVDEETNQQMTDQQVFDEVMTIVIAGYETTATALTWLCIALQQYPEVLEKLRAEIAQVLGNRPPAFEDVPHLTYTLQVFLEVMRMYTVVPFLPRALNKADQLGNYHLSANALLLVFYHGVHHNPRVWENPEVFDPERFTFNRLRPQHSFAYVPFSGGPRKCAGEELALLEGPLAIAMMLQKYNFRLLPNQTFAARLSSTMQPRNGVKATFSLRSAS
jgi:cytochrome P450